MGKQTHIIRKLVLEIGVPTKAEALSIQNRLSEEYKQIILDIIEDLLDKLVATNEIITVDTLEIDLGDISKAHLSEQVARKVKTEMENALVKILSDVRQSSGGSSIVRFTTSTGTSVSANVSRQSIERSELETLMYFLEFGVLPWSANRNVKPSLQEMVAAALEKYPEQLRAAIAANRRKRNIFKRLAMQLPVTQLHYLAAILGCSFSSQLPSIIEQLIKLLPAVTIVDLKTVKQRSEAIDERTIAEEILYYFSNEDCQSDPAYNGPDEPQIKFIFHLLRKMFSGSEAGKLRIRPIPAEFKVIPEVKKAFSFFLRENKTKTYPPEQIPQDPRPVKKEDSFTPEAEEGIYIGNAGLLILHPYLGTFFHHLGLLNEKQFVNEKAAFRAVHILHWLVYGDERKEKTNEHELLLNKIFCGLEEATPVPLELKLSKKEKKESTALLEAVIKNWPALKNTSVHGLRVTFLQKEGALRKNGKDWDLIIQRNSAVEFLIDRLPWGISVVKLPWSENVIYSLW